MNQVPADKVIAILTQEIADLHREQAILKVQVEMLNEELSTTQVTQDQPQVSPVSSVPDNVLLPSIPPLPGTSSAA